jgi:hypothetical protein
VLEVLHPSGPNGIASASWKELSISITCD